MGTLIRNCPHCHAANSSFRTFSEYKNPACQNTEYLAALQCGGCHGGYFIRVAVTGGHTPHGHNGDIGSDQYMDIIDEYPQPTTIDAPEHLPENITSFFVQSAQSLKSGNLDAAAMMARKVLEVSVKTLNTEGSGSLYKRIEELHDLGRVTDDLKEWAHIIRDDGNEAAHEEQPVTTEFADELLAFTELFLMYTFTMPGMVSERMGRDD